LKANNNFTTAETQEQLTKAIALHQKGRLGDAQKIYKEILKTNPKKFEALHFLGIIAAQSNDHETAVDLISKAIASVSNDARTHYNLGSSLQALRRYKSAVECYDQAIRLAPNYAIAFSNRAAVFKELNQFEAALANYDNAISLNPLNAEDYANRAVVLQGLHQTEAAIASCDQAISIMPSLPRAYYNRGTALLDLKRLDEAITDFEIALKIKPDYEYLFGVILHTRAQLCDWHSYHINLVDLFQKIQDQKKVTSCFPLLALTDSLSLQRKSTGIWSVDKYPGMRFLDHLPKRASQDKIRIGYFSADFHNHATAYLMAELFERHNKEKFELIAFSFGPDTKDDMQFRVSQAFDKFINVVAMSDEEVALLSRDLGVNIAIDLKGLTKDARIGIFSYKAAPIQVSYLGYPGTLGADYIDYLIADKTLIPPESQPHYSEKIVYLPNSYQVNDRQKVIAPKQFTKQELGLPQDSFVFCCFNNNFKITPDIFDTWVRILKAVEASVLWLFQDNPTAATNLQKEAALRGLDPARLVFAKRMDLPQHLARHKVADLFLDTLPYNAHTTASDALWAGLPVLTCMGESFASRVAASLLKAIGLPELITQTPEDYESLAIELATKPGKLQSIKDKLAANRLITPLFDTALFTQHIEEAYEKMYERYLADLPPDHIEV
jgi:predicted O-linked N-acetylglucosamine transferase (SPINDLY family)